MHLQRIATFDEHDDDEEDYDEDEPEEPNDEDSKPADEENSPWLNVTDDPVPQGCAKYDGRLKLRQRLDSGRITQNQWAAAFKKLADKTDPKNAKKTPELALEMPLLHGSFVVMHGKGMQRVYEVRREMLAYTF